MAFLNNNGLSTLWSNIIAKIGEKMPKKVSELENDKNYLTIDTLPKYDGGVD